MYPGGPPSGIQNEYGYGRVEREGEVKMLRELIVDEKQKREH